MLPRELVKELFGGSGPTRLHVLKTLANAFNGFRVVLVFPFQIVCQGIIQSVGGALPAPASKLLQLRQSVRLQGKRFHTVKVELHWGDVNGAYLRPTTA